jgi:hypothetical protein
MKLKLFYFIFSILGFTASYSANAETDNTLAGLPGFFDTSTPEEGKVTLSLPLTSIDYGITDRWSIGTNFIAEIAPAANRKIPLYLNTRYRFYDRSGFTSAASLYTYDAYNNSKNHFYSALLSWNNQYYLTPRNMITLSVNGYIGKERYEGVTLGEGIIDTMFENLTSLREIIDYHSVLHSGGFGAIKYMGYITKKWAISTMAGFISHHTTNDEYIKGYEFLGQYNPNPKVYSSKYNTDTPFYTLEMEFVKQKDYRLSFGVVYVPQFYDTLNERKKGAAFPMLDYIVAF